jgi:hypothetical protein
MCDARTMLACRPSYRPRTRPPRAHLSRRSRAQTPESIWPSESCENNPKREGGATGFIIGFRWEQGVGRSGGLGGVASGSALAQYALSDSNSGCVPSKSSTFSFFESGVWDDEEEAEGSVRVVCWYRSRLVRRRRRSAMGVKTEFVALGFERILFNT